MQLVRIRLRKPRRVFTFLSYDLVLKRDDPCVVQSDRGLEIGEVVLPPEPLADERTARTNMRVIRRMNEDDHQTRQRLEEEERKGRSVCLEKIRERRMAMKLVDVEYTFDKKKIIFYFTAEDRVDFRELVRDLAHALKTRIELRHIQVRDEAKMVGGIGGCGRELCCSTWLNEFKPISMRMAKRQNLSLNPSKISGQCGRLLCCLSYENDMYESVKRRKRSEAEAPRRETPRPAGTGETGAWTQSVPAETAREAPRDAGQPDAPRQSPRNGDEDKPRRRRGGRGRKRRRKPPGNGGDQGQN